MSVLDPDTFTGAHPTAREFHDQLLAWGFSPRRGDAVHHLLRAPGGGTVRLLRALTGRADSDLVAKAARFLSVTEASFWAGPVSEGECTPQPTAIMVSAAEDRDRLTVLVRTGRHADPADTAPSDIPPTGAQTNSDLFRALFPSGVNMTAEVYAELQEWQRLTQRLAARAS